MTAQTLRTPRPLKLKFLKWIPVVCHSFVTIACTYIIISERWFVDKPLTDWILDIFKLNLMLPSVLMIVSNISAKGKLQTIPNSLLNLINSTEKQFGVNFSVGKFMKFHNFYIFMKIGFHLLTSIHLEFIPLPWCSMMTDKVITIAKVFNNAFELYFLFQISLLHCMLKFLNSNLEQHSKLTKIDANRRFHILNYVSYAYCEVWVIKNNIERRLGWPLMAVFLDKFIQFTIHLYDIFRIIAKKGSALQMMRK